MTATTDRDGQERSNCGYAICAKRELELTRLHGENERLKEYCSLRKVEQILARAEAAESALIALRIEIATVAQEMETALRDNPHMEGLWLKASEALKWHARLASLAQVDP